MLVILIIAGIMFIISGIDTYKEPSTKEWIEGQNNSFIDYSNEIEGFSYIITGTAFIIAGLCLIVRLKEKH